MRGVKKKVEDHLALKEAERERKRVIKTYLQLQGKEILKLTSWLKLTIDASDANAFSSSLLIDVINKTLITLVDKSIYTFYIYQMHLLIDVNHNYWRTK